jgi:hypothetical protein
MCKLVCPGCHGSHHAACFAEHHSGAPCIVQIYMYANIHVLRLLQISNRHLSMEPGSIPNKQTNPNKEYFFECPHCGGGILVREADIKCTIFRHAAFRGAVKLDNVGVDSTGISPHAPKSDCDQMVQENKIWGCGLPFRFTGNFVQKLDEYI